MSSLRNAVKRVTHKERAQPARRKRLGLLEKSKDYKLRAKDWHAKQTALRRLHSKAAARNPEEFYHGMIKARTRGGVHEVQADKHVSADVVKLVRSQNINYLRVHESAEARRIEKMRGSLHFIGSDAAAGTHTLFLDDEQEARSFIKAEFFETTPAFEDRAFNRPTKAALAKAPLLAAGAPADVADSLRELEHTYDELEQRVRRKRQMGQALRHMEAHKLLSSKGARIKIKDATKGQPAQYKWKQERKR